MFRYALLCLTLLLPLGCVTPKAWDKPGAAPDERQQAIAACRQEAAARMRSHRIYSEERFHGQTMDSSGSGNLSSTQERMQEAEIVDLRDRLFSECMHGKGYSLRPVRR